MLRNLNQSFSRGRICGTRHSGVLGSQIASDGTNGPGYAYNDLVFPDDANKDIAGYITTLPVGLDYFFAYEDTAFEAQGPAGDYTFQYQLKVNGVDTGSPATATISISPAVLGTIDALQQPNTMNASGGTIHTGSLFAQQLKNTAAFSGGPRDSGPISASQKKNVAALSGGTQIAATFGVQQRANTSAMSGSVSGSTPAAQIDAQQKPGSAVIAGSVSTGGQLASVAAKGTASIAARAAISGTIATTQKKATASLAGTVFFSVPLESDPIYVIRPQPRRYKVKPRGT